METLTSANHGKDRDTTARSPQHPGIEQALGHAADSADRHFDGPSTKFDHQLQRMRLQLEELEAAFAQKAGRAARAADRTAHTHPYGAMGFAATIGLLAGVLLARRD